MKIIWHRRFKKHFVSLPQKIKDKTMYTISVFIQDPHSSALRNHSLSGEYV
jgi:mRNA-degrading endonuclease YafQ of YafQ-DinJ toxin-antitoxin module